MDLQWWISVIGVPVSAGLLAFIWRVQGSADKVDKKANEIRHELYEYKLQVATTFSSLSHMRDVEQRIVNRLDKIDAKLDDMAKR